MIPIPLRVDLETAHGHYRVTRDLGNLSFRTVVPGGFASCQIALDRPLDIDPVDIAYYGTLTVSDGRHGGVVWQGRMEDPSRGVGSDGRIWDVSAVGPSAHVEDRTVPLVYVFRDLGSFHRGSSLEASRFVLDEVGSEPALMLHAPSGDVWSVNDQARARSILVREAGQHLARVSFNMVGGTGDTDWEMQAFVSDTTTTELIRNSVLTTAQQGLASFEVGSDWTLGRDRIVFRLINKTSESGNQNKWAKFWDVRVRATMYDAEGNELATASDYTTDTVLASEVVADLLGRLLDQYDGATASIDTTTTEIRNLTYVDGVTPRKVLQDLELFEPDHYWAAWEKTHNDKHRFEYTEWPTTVAYDATTDDGYTSSGSADELYNAVTVRYRESAVHIRMITRTTTVEVLDDAGITRTAFLDLGEDIANVDDAIEAGDNFLEEHGIPPNSGQLTIARPIIDYDRGRLVQPWEILPGKLIRVRGIQPRIDALNPGGRDGVSVFKVVGVDYDAGQAAATLELDSNPRTLAHAITTSGRWLTQRNLRR